MDIYHELIKEHEKIKELFNAISNKKNDIELLYHELVRDIILHTHAEERILYSKIRSRLNDNLTITIDICFIEHGLITSLLSKLEEVNINTPDWQRLFSLLKKTFFGHTKKEAEFVYVLAKEHIFDKESHDLVNALMAQKEALKKRLDPLLNSPSLHSLIARLTALIRETNDIEQVSESNPPDHHLPFPPLNKDEKDDDEYISS